ncbi:hypothetical protein RESH_01108 [Rhodopirellula europaea SH398]|uniref:Uncharacterized protein n=1 Tax=Rhodopirellula europaea SH398 TaxID=1263868 RepID=M5SKP2_9BACT|nr:hypothetical protein RESH_01108 [Rhodopirellula europaea SH398]
MSERKKRIHEIETNVYLRGHHRPRRYFFCPLVSSSDVTH